MTEEKQCGPVCPITGCPISKVLMMTIVTALVAFGFDWLVHGNLLKADYAAYASLWRPEETMQAFLPYCILYHVVFAFAISGLYCFVAKGSACKGACPMTGIKFGLLVGLMLGITDFAAYIWLPMENTDLVIKWLIAGIVRGVLLGYVLSMLCKQCCKKSACEKTSSCCK